MIRYNHKNRGFTLLIAVVVTSFLLIVSFVLANVALKQLLISNANQQSQYSFYNADSGTECALYWDLTIGTDAFSTTSVDVINCNGEVISTGTQPNIPTNPASVSRVGGGGNGAPTSIFMITFTRGCAIVTVNKAYVSGNLVTTINSKGYNTCDTTSLRRFERGITLTY
ncbi:MAG TPA: hypothetical protein VGC58_02405 [Candidatus Paceibacterota bacterium]